MYESPSFATYSQAIARPPPPGAVVPTYNPATYSLATYGAPRAPSVWDTYRSMFVPPQPQTTPLESAVTGLRHNGEGMAIAALLAFAQRQFGTLDVRGKYPADAILGACLFALSIKEAGKPDGYASDLRALSQSCSSIYMYRKILGDPARETGASPTTFAPVQKSGVSSTTDPILQAARQAGF